MLEKHGRLCRGDGLRGNGCAVRVVPREPSLIIGPKQLVPANVSAIRMARLVVVPVICHLAEAIGL